MTVELAALVGSMFGVLISLVYLTVRIGSLTDDIKEVKADMAVLAIRRVKRRTKAAAKATNA